MAVGTDLMRAPPRNPAKDQLLSEQLLFLAYGQLGLIQVHSNILEIYENLYTF